MRLLRELIEAGRGKAHVGTGAFARPVEQSSTAVFAAAGCPILARSLRKGGIPRVSIAGLSLIHISEPTRPY